MLGLVQMFPSDTKSMHAMSYVPVVLGFEVDHCASLMLNAGIDAV